MTREYYVLHYFDFKNSGKFFLVAFFGLILILAVILTFARKSFCPRHQQKSRQLTSTQWTAATKNTTSSKASMRWFFPRLQFFSFCHYIT